MSEISDRIISLHAHMKGRETEVSLIKTEVQIGR